MQKKKSQSEFSFSGSSKIGFEKYLVPGSSKESRTSQTFLIAADFPAAPQFYDRIVREADRTTGAHRHQASSSRPNTKDGARIYTGWCDLSSEMFAIARKKEISDTRVIHHDITEPWPVPDSSTDIVVFSLVLAR